MRANLDNKADIGALNGVSYKRLKSKSRTDEIKFNNGEPVNLAVKKIICQLLVIILTILAVFGVFILKEKVIDKFTDDSVFTLSMNQKYSAPVKLDGITVAPFEEAPAYGIVEAVAKFNKQTDVSAAALLSKGGKDLAETPDGLLTALKENVKGIDISVKNNISNYTYLTEIYESLNLGEPVIVPLAISKSATAKGPDTYGYAVVTGVDFASDKITVLDFFGKNHEFSAEKFIAATRFSEFKDMPISLKLSFTLGFRARNTAFIISKE